ALKDKKKQTFANINKELDNILTPAQGKRLRQLEIQQRGPSALFAPEVRKNLDLSAEQIKDISAALRNQFQKLGAALKDLKGDREALAKKMAELNKAALEDAVKVLTPAQQGKWKELAGEPYKGTLPPLG